MNILRLSAILKGMKNFFSKFVCSSLVLAVSLATVLCCNFAKMAEASSSVHKTTHSSSCCPSQSDKTKIPGKANECCNPQLQADFLTPNAFNIAFITTHYALLAILLSAPEFSNQDEFQLAYLNGPPAHFSGPQLYIHFHNFRI